jgi:hypothetical protein
MRRLRGASVCLAPALLLFSTQAGAAKPQPSKVQRTEKAVSTLAMDGPRVAYASGNKIRVWNVATGATSVVTGRYGGNYANDVAAEVAIAGTRVAWIKRNWIGNTEASESLYTGTIGGRAHLRLHAHRYGRDDPLATKGSWIAGVVGSGKVLAVSTWKSDGTTASDERLRRLTPTGVRPIVAGPGAVVAESADAGRVAVLRSTAAWPYGMQPLLSPAPTAGIYSSSGALLGEVALSPPGPDSTDIQIALSGDLLVALTTALHEPAGPTTVTLEVYDWRSGDLLHTWPVGITANAGEVSFAAHGRLAAVEGPSRLHLVDLDTGKDVEIAPASHTGSPPAIDSRGLVYALSAGRSAGKLVFVPLAALLARVG